MGPIALFSKYRLTISSGKHLEDISHVHFVSLVFKLITSSRHRTDLPLGFDRDRKSRQCDLTKNKIIKLVRIMLKDAFGFGEHQEKATYGVGNKLTLTKSKDDAVLNKAEATADARILIDIIPWHVPHYTPCIPQQAF